jgi:hypothetical protein
MRRRKSKQKHSNPKNASGTAPVKMNSTNHAEQSNKCTQIANKICDWLKKFSDPIIVVTLLLFGATLWLCIVTRDLVKDAEKTAERQLRAYLSINTGSGLRRVPDSILFVIDNFGQTPAKKVRSVANVEFREKGEELPPDFSFPDRDICGNKQSSLPNLGTISPKNPTLSWLHICDEQNQKLNLAEKMELNGFFYGHIDYEDIFDICVSDIMSWTPSTSRTAQAATPARLAARDRPGRLAFPSTPSVSTGG